MKCLGGNKTTPVKCYWRESAMSTFLFQCPNLEACLAGDEANPTGICATGNSGLNQITKESGVPIASTATTRPVRTPNS